MKKIPERLDAMQAALDCGIVMLKLCDVHAMGSVKRVSRDRLEIVLLVEPFLVQQWGGGWSPRAFRTLKLKSINQLRWTVADIIKKRQNDPTYLCPPFEEGTDHFKYDLHRRARRRYE